MKSNIDKLVPKKILVLIVLLFSIILTTTFINLNQKTNEKLNSLIIRISKTSTWYDIKYGFEIFIDKLKKDAYLFLNNNPSKLEKYNIAIQPADLRRIENIISSKKFSDNLNEEDEKWFPINFSDKNSNYPAKIRIRGDQSIHWVNKKKSWKIKFSKEKLFNNKKSIHLIIPKERAMEVELTAIKIAKHYGLLVPDSGFKLISQNNRNMGLYYWLESIDQYFLERNGYPVGEIIVSNDIGLQNDNLLDKDLINFYKLNTSSYRTTINSNNEISSIAFFQWKNFLELLNSNDPELINSKIENFINIDKFATWNSILMIFGNSHGLSINNVRWFYDPTTGLFEPIINDVLLGTSTFEEFEVEINNPIITNILKSYKVREARLKILNKLVNNDDEYLINTFKETYTYISPYIYFGAEGYNIELKGVGINSPKDLFYTHNNRLGILRSNIENIKKSLSTNRLFIETRLSFSNKDNLYNINIINQGLSPVSIKKIIFLPSNEDELLHIEEDTNFLLINNQGYKKIIKPNNVKLDKKKWVFEFNNLDLKTPRFGNYIRDNLKKNDEPEMKWTVQTMFKYKEVGNKRLFNHIPSQVDFIVINNLTKEPIPYDNINRSKIIINDIAKLQFKGKEINNDLSNIFLNENETFLTEIPDSRIISEKKYIMKGKDIIFPRGNYKILKDLIIPNNYNLIINSGVNFYMSPNVNILIKGGNLNIKGTKINPVIIDQLIVKKNWGTISILSAKKISNISYAKILNGGSNIKFLAKGVYYTGQLNFFHSDIKIDNTYIEYSNAEDAINVKKSFFSFNKVVLRNNKFDAFDGDWANGEIKNSIISTNGNDGLDFSGSKVVIKDSILNNMGDKSLSVGEQSTIDIINCIFVNSNYAIAVKDLSKVRVFGSSIYNNNYGIAVYRKKPIFGSGVITVFGSLIWNNTKNFMPDENARIILNNTGLKEKALSKQIKTINVRVGDIHNQFKIDTYGNPIPSDKLKLSKQFLKGPSVKGKDLNGNNLPDLSKYNIGMVKKLNLDGKVNQF